MFHNTNDNQLAQGYRLKARVFRSQNWKIMGERDLQVCVAVTQDRLPCRLGKKIVE